MMNQDTICAIATAQGGAIGSIRVSGPEAISITGSIFKPAKAGKLLSEQKPYTLTFGRIYDEDEMIDEVLVSLFRSPHSYTGEDSTEITCHGSTYILQQVMQLLIKNGCRMAQPGEYTQRAFLNGKMDLSQAEAVADLIASSSAATHRLAMSQMRGGFSKELTDLRNKLLNFTSMIELELDFSEEDVEFADRSALRKLADEIEQVISRLAHSFSVGNAIKNGVPVAIIGETNAGKSTLLNVLLNEDKAIVSDIHGTTRDVIEDTVNIGGITFRFIDTAGIRRKSKVTEKIEQYIKKEFGGHICAAYGCSLGGSFVGLLVARGNIHMEYGILGGSDLDQSGKFLAKLMTKLMMPVFYPFIANGEMKIPFMKKKMDKMLAEDNGYIRALMDMIKTPDVEMSHITKRSVENQFYSDLITPLPDQIDPSGTQIHIL